MPFRRSVCKSFVRMNLWWVSIFERQHGHKYVFKSIFAKGHNLYPKIMGRVPSPTEMIDLGSIPKRLKAKIRKFGIQSFPAWRSAISVKPPNGWGRLTWRQKGPSAVSCQGNSANEAVYNYKYIYKWIIFHRRTWKSSGMWANGKLRLSATTSSFPRMYSKGAYATSGKPMGMYGLGARSISSIGYNDKNSSGNLNGTWGLWKPTARKKGCE